MSSLVRTIFSRTAGLRVTMFNNRLQGREQVREFVAKPRWSTRFAIAAVAHIRLKNLWWSETVQSSRCPILPQRMSRFPLQRSPRRSIARLEQAAQAPLGKVSPSACRSEPPGSARLGSPTGFFRSPLGRAK